MSKLQWHLPEDQTFESGLDKGVIYLENGTAVPWNGLVSVEDASEATTQAFFIDGIKFLTIVTPRDWKGRVTALTYPDEFSGVVGISRLADGLYVDSQIPDRFNLCYRTGVSAPNATNKQHYKIHLIYKATAALMGFVSETIGDSIEPNAFEFELDAVPIAIPLKRPTAHVILDTRDIDPATMATIEGMLYGTPTTDPVFPTITQLTNLLQFGPTVIVVDNGDGTWTATGSAANITMLSDDTFQLKNSPAEVLTATTYRFPNAPTA